MHSSAVDQFIMRRLSMQFETPLKLPPTPAHTLLLHIPALSSHIYIYGIAQ
jgi:hypothetical protein